MDLLRDFLVLNSGNGSDSSKIRFASNLGFLPTLLKHVNRVSNSENSRIIHGSKDVIHQDKMPCASVGPNSSRKEGDTPTVRQVKGLSQEVTGLLKELESKNILIKSLKVPEKAPEVELDSGSSWKDKVSPPGETHARMNLCYFPPDVDGEKVRVSPPKHVKILGSVKWKNCIVGHFVDKKLAFLVVQSIAVNAWGKFGLKTVLSNEKGFFFFLFGEEASGKVVTDRIKYPWRPTKCDSCRVFGHNECNKNKVGVIESDKLTVIASAVAPTKVWVVKGSKGDCAAGLVSSVLPTQTTPDPMRIAQKSPVHVEVLPCVNQFSALQEEEGVRSSIVVELPIGRSEVDVI
ncbi:hypothetical protein RHGRI_002227 [Rhododendron griersonianum]|uniref:DUF4283 domain-containing protein n=1 Tax=Rhododendron griersonianum TaxID=479676 RepID=A0AAV6LP11_9ERIC|nr:hypothetical protein RHGRI_002227 [Rhododendron griersonianum]